MLDGHDAFDNRSDREAVNGSQPAARTLVPDTLEGEPILGARPSVADAFVVPSLRTSMRGERRLLIVVRSASPGLAGRSEVARRSLRATRTAGGMLGVRIEHWMPSHGALTRLMFGEHDSLAKAAMVKSWPVSDHHVIDLPHQPISVSLFRGPTQMHAPALGRFLAPRFPRIGGLFMLSRNEISCDGEEFAAFANVLAAVRQAQDLWVADSESGEWDWGTLPSLLA